MSVSEALVSKAVEILTRAKFTQRWSLEDVSDRLSGYSPFDDLDDDELSEIAKAARARLLPAAAPQQRPVQRGHATDTGSSGSARPCNVMPSAPFRFVTLPDIVAPREPDTRHDLPIPGGFSGRIALEWAAEGPLLIGENKDGVAEPLRMPGESGGYVIPGATQRGLTRAGLEIVAHGRIGPNANLHHRYGLRDFEHPGYSERSDVSRVDEVKAGWLRWETGKDGAERTWTIEPLGRNWSHVPIEKLLGANAGRFRARSPKEWCGSDLQAKYREIGILQGDVIDFARTFPFSNAAPDNNRRIAVPGGPRQGIFVFSNKLPGSGTKKFEYVFFDEPTGKRIALEPEVIETFERLYSKPSKNRPEAVGSWALLKKTLEAGKRLPVFYVGDLADQGSRFAFGLTRLFKVPHERSVEDVLAAQPAHLPKPVRDAAGIVTGYDADFVENLFGYVVESDALGLPRGSVIAPDAVGRKGRVSFSFARLLNPADAQVSQTVTTVMMAPRASFAPFYLKSTAERDYSAETRQQLAGRKRYLPRGRETDAGATLAAIGKMGQRQLELIEQQSKRPAGDDVKSRLRFLMPRGKAELRFGSEIRFHNTTAAELGGLLFVLTHGGDPEKPYRHLMGRAKPFGAGQMRLAKLKLSVVPNDGDSPLVQPPEQAEVADEEGRRGFTPAPGGDVAANASLRPFLAAFVQRMRSVPGLGAFPDVLAVREFLGASDPVETAGLEGLDYMPLAAFGDLRKAVKPMKGRDGRPAQRPARIGIADGRLLPAPATKRRFWI